MNYLDEEKQNNNFNSSLILEVFFRREEKKRKKEAAGELPLVASDVNMIQATKTTHLSINNSQSEYAINFLKSGGRVRS